MRYIEKQIEQYLYQLNINALYEESQILGFDINMENTLLGVRIICDNYEKRVMVFAEAPFNIPKEKMNDGDNPPIGIILCSDKSDTLVKYTLPEGQNQIYASKYMLYIPSEEELRKEILLERENLENK